MDKENNDAKFTIEGNPGQNNSKRPIFTSCIASI